MSFSFTIQLNDPNNFPVDAALVADAQAAVADWSRYFNGLGSIDVQINIVPTPPSNNPVAEGSPGISVPVGIDGVRTVFEPGTIAEMLTGNDPNAGSPDAIINFDPLELTQLWLDPDPVHPSAIPANRVDGISVLRHELAHALGVTGTRNDNTGALAPNSESTWDRLVRIDPDGSAWFTGANAEAVFGGAVPLETLESGSKYYHIGTAAGTDLLNAMPRSGTSDQISPLDIAMLTDADGPSVMAPNARLAFFSSAVSADKVNVIVTADGADAAGKAIAGDFNIEVFTTRAGALANGFQASALVPGAAALTNNAIQAVVPAVQLLDGGYSLIDLSTPSRIGTAIRIVGSAGTVDFVVGSAGDTITGSTNSAVRQVVDASGTNKNANPGPFAGPQTVVGGAGGTTVAGGKGDSITGGAGAMQVNDAVLASGGGETVSGGAGALTVFSLGGKSSVGAGSGTLFIDDTYAGGSNSSIVGGNGSGLIAGGGLGGGLGANTVIIAGGDNITIGSALTYVHAGAGSTTIRGGDGTVTGAPAGAGGFNTAILAGKNDVIKLGSASTLLDANALPATGTTVTGGTGLATVYGGAGTLVTGGPGTIVVNAFAGADTVAGGAGNLTTNVFGKSASVTGSTGGWTAIQDNFGKGGGSTLVGGSGTVTGAGAAGFSTFIVGAAGDSIVGGAGATSVNAFLGNQTVTGGSGSISVQAGAGDVLNGGAGALLAFLDSDQATTTVNLGAGHGAATLQDVSVAGGKGDAIYATGFAAATDIIGSAQSVDATNKFLGSSSSDGNGGTLLTLLDGSTITLAGIASGTTLKFLHTTQ